MKEEYNLPESQEEFLEDVRRAYGVSDREIFGIETYAEIGKFSAWHTAYVTFDYDSWSDVLDDADVPTRSKQNEILFDLERVYQQEKELNRDIYGLHGDYSPEEVEEVIEEDHWSKIERLLKNDSDQA